MTQGEIFKNWVKDKGLTALEVASILGVGRQHVYNIFKESVISNEHREKLRAKGLDVEAVQKMSSPNSADLIKNMTVVPLKAFGGFLLGYANRVFADSMEYAHFPFIRGECFAFEVDGFSMFKTKHIDGDIYEVGYKPGSYVVATALEGPESLSKDKDYVFATTDGIIIKRFVKVDGERCHLRSINEDYKPISLPMKSIKKVFFVEHKIDKP